MPAPAVVGWLVNGLVAAASSFVLQALFGVGVAMVVNEYALPPIIETLRDQLSTAPQLFVDALVYVRADQAMTIILSAYIVRAGASRVQGLKKR